MKLQIHLHKSLLHVLDVGDCVFHKPLPLAQIGAQRCDFGIRAEAAPQQTVGMELAQPSGIADVCFAPRHVLGVTRINQNNLEPVLLKRRVFWFISGVRNEQTRSTRRSNDGGCVMGSSMALLRGRLNVAPRLFAA